ncbi:Peptidyl-lysine N-acetyltransferase PatZ [Cupriavidus laharis]|uniref:Peptidyl-lysine N-acetyltransferase PatZ n=1 Tax=Cupriavidus laharis TaxID=151654 RepID=A0ABM8WTE2_9BURK|nr:GNAT family protein [Cupriavidus laharis]CAG9170747.1 Peptidyl-lysine N-acetyltransferase PatZ [Cupriavidus laharis]
MPTRLTLRDGRHVLLREICEQDRAGLLAAFARLSDDARYTRFMAPMRELPDVMVEQATHPEPGHECALVAVSDGDGKDGGGRLVGGARFVAPPGSEVCEFAITLDDDWHGVGLARGLMTPLIAMARARGYQRMEGFVLAMNTPMRRLARRLGFTDVACPDDPTVRIVTLPLGEKAAVGGAG